MGEEVGVSESRRRVFGGQHGGSRRGLVCGQGKLLLLRKFGTVSQEQSQVHSRMVGSIRSRKRSLEAGARTISISARRTDMRSGGRGLQRANGTRKAKLWTGRRRIQPRRLTWLPTDDGSKHEHRPGSTAPSAAVQLLFQTETGVPCSRFAL